ncbi:MAG: NADH-quinone oxidoreductase subunit N [Candidatus Njordarchaeia archaeon]
MFDLFGVTIGDTEFLVGLLGFLAFINALLDFKEEKLKDVAYYLSIIGSIIGLTYSVYLWGGTSSLFLADQFTRVFSVIFLGSLFLILISLKRNLSDVPRQGLLHSLILLSVAGMIIATSTYNIVTLIAGWELGSIPTYAMIALKRDDAISLEAATKFLIVGAVGSAITLFGFSLIFGATGTLDLNAVRTAVQISGENPLLNYGILILISGIGFKLAIFPFYVWIPDVIEGAPNLLSAYILAVSKGMAFAVAMRIFYVGLPYAKDYWVPIFAILALITMTFGNLAALVQKKMKRMLAYSSIAHAGYILLVVSALGPTELVAGAIFHVLTHALMKIVAFVTALIVLESINSDLIEDYAGMIKRSPLITLILSIDMLALAGVPPLVGFWSKWFLFLGIADTYWWLGLAGALNSAMSLYYYARVIKVMILDEPKEDSRIVGSVLYWIPAILGTIAIIGMGVLPNPIYNFILKAAEILVST